MAQRDAANAPQEGVFLLSSIRQLPVPMALDARWPTLLLFVGISITQTQKVVNLFPQVYPYV